MDPDSTFSALGDLALIGDLLEVDDELFGVVLGVSEKFGRVESEHMIRDGLWRFGEEVGVVCRVSSVDMV